MGNTAVSEWVFGLGIWPLLVMVVPTVTVFRKRGREVVKKQLASLYQAIGVFLISASAGVVVSRGLNDFYFLGAVVVIGGLAFLLRRHVFPYRLTCPECGHRHRLTSEQFRNIYVMDDNLCNECRARLATRDDE